MIRTIFENFLRAFLLIALQVFILNNIGLGGYINPYVYILAIFLLPLETPAWLTQIISFAIGIVVDSIVSTPGMHTSACVFIGFLRPFVLKYIAPRDGYDPDIEASIKDMGFPWFFKYIVVLTFAHHIFLFIVETFNFVNIGHTMIRILLSGIFTITIIVLFQYLKFGNARKR
jgi:hypothetical protein